MSGSRAKKRQAWQNSRMTEPRPVLHHVQSRRRDNDRLTLRAWTCTAALCILVAPLARAQEAESRVAGWVVSDATLPRDAAPAADGIGLTRGIAYRPDANLRDGVIEFDLGPAGTAFAGIAFRMQSAASYEIIYFRPDSGRWAAIQYQPVFEGETTWQLYHGDGYEGTIPAHGDGRLHVKIIVAGTRADVYVGGDSTPALRVRELKRPTAAGGIGFWVAGGAQPDGTNGALSALTMTPSSSLRLTPVEPETHPPEQLIRWRVSPRMPSPDSIAPPLTPPAAAAADVRRWRVVAAEPSGLVDLTCAIGNAAGPQRVNVFGGAGWGMAFAHVTITSPRAQTRRLFVSYSDGIGVYLNGTRVFVGRNDADSRGPGYLGIVGPEVEFVDLPLRAGGNELLLGVTDKAFGWGFRARLVSLRGVSITP
jgi:hypothetical protein